MSSIRGTTRSGSSSSRDRKAPSTEPAFAALAGPVTSVRGKRSNLGSGADGKVAPGNPCLTRFSVGLHRYGYLPSDEPHESSNCIRRGPLGQDPQGAASEPHLHGDL